LQTRHICRCSKAMSVCDCGLLSCVCNSETRISSATGGGGCESRQQARFGIDDSLQQGRGSREVQVGRKGVEGSAFRVSLLLCVEGKKVLLTGGQGVCEIWDARFASLGLGTSRWRRGWPHHTLPDAASEGSSGGRCMLIRGYPPQNLELKAGHDFRGHPRSRFYGKPVSG
jgi:hypothetical protein